MRQKNLADPIPTHQNLTLACAHFIIIPLLSIPLAQKTLYLYQTKLKIKMLIIA